MLTEPGRCSGARGSELSHVGIEMSAIDRDELLRLECLFLGAQLEIGQDSVIGQGDGHQQYEGSAVPRLTCLAMPSFAPVNLFPATPW